MDINKILNIALIVLTILSTFIGYYFKIKEKVLKEINGLINNAEDGESIGADKMQSVVDNLYKLVPVAYRGILNKNVLEKMVQLAFDKIEDYAKKQLNKNNNGQAK